MGGLVHDTNALKRNLVQDPPYKTKRFCLRLPPTAAAPAQMLLPTLLPLPLREMSTPYEL